MDKRIAKGENPEIMPENLTKVNIPGYANAFKRCSSCSYETKEDFEYCPKCGNRF